VTPARQRVHIRQLCCLGLPGEQLMPTLLKAIREFVEADSAGFFWVDSRGDMTGLYAERILPAPVMKLYFERYYEDGDSSFRRGFAERAGQPEAVMAVSPSAATERSGYYNDVLKTLDAHHVLYGIVREQGRALGQLSLYRPKAAPAFTSAQRSELTSIMPYVAHGIAQRGSVAADVSEFVDTEDDAMFMTGLDGGIHQFSMAARKLLTLAILGKLGPGRELPDIEEAARPALRRLADRLRSILAAEEAGPPSLVLENAWGRFVMRAYAIEDGPLEARSPVAIRIRRQEPLLLRFVGALDDLGLSPQQREIAVGLARGSTNAELAAVLGITPNTVAYHVKQLFHRLDAHDRRQMVATVMARRTPRA
jgi:DNA-binding CsgD family transcriptional regulator